MIQMLTFNSPCLDKSVGLNSISNPEYIKVAFKVALLII